MAKKTEPEPASPGPTPMVAPAPAERLAPFLDIIASGEVPYVRIAELADVTVADVEAFVLALEPDRVEPEIEPPDAVVPTPPREASGSPPVQDMPSPGPSANVATAPHSVRCLRKARILDPSGRPWRIGTRDVYSGHLAEFLWTRHRELVEAFPLRPG